MFEKLYFYLLGTYSYSATCALEPEPPLEGRVGRYLSSTRGGRPDYTTTSTSTRIAWYLLIAQYPTLPSYEYCRVGYLTHRKKLGHS